MKPMTWLWIMFGGALGALARYGITVLQLKALSTVTWPSTLVVNAIGCLGLGICFAIWKGPSLSLTTKFFWMVGFWGSFTTFSTFSLDMFTMIERQQYKTLGFYIVASIILGLTFFIFGYKGFQTMSEKKEQTEKNTLNQFGIERIDPYAWLKDKKDPKVIEHLENENKRTQKYFEQFKDVEESLYREMISRINEDDESYPHPYKGYEYFSKIQKGENYRKYYRKKLDSDQEELLLDANVLAKDKDFLSIGSFEISPSGNRVAYSVDFDGSEAYTIYIQDLQNNTVLDHSIEHTTGDLEWGKDDTQIFYQTFDQTHRPYRIFLHQVGQDTTKDQKIFEDSELSNFVGMYKSRSERFLFITSQSKLSSEAYFVDLSKEQIHVQQFAPRKKDTLISIDHHEENFVIHTNENAIDFKVLTTSIDQLDPDNWKEVFAHKEGRFIEDVSVFKQFWILWERFKGNQHLRIYFPDQDQSVELPFTEKAFALSGENNAEYDTFEYRFGYSSMKTPHSVLSFNIKTKKIDTLKVKTVPGDFHPDNYIVDKIFAPSRDGKAQIPISLIKPKNLVQDGQAKVLLYGYGSYGISVDPGFNVPALSMVDRGFIYAIAHIRGSSTNGRSWYEDGKFLKKENTFNDFIDCAHHLIDQQYTQKKNIAIMGGSAGGLLMGAVVNQAPELWGAVLALVPFVDIVNTMLDDTLPLTVTEYDEWGNPHEEKYFRYMYGYAPYENIQDASFPPILATGGINDPRVGFWEPAKWVMRLRDHQLAKDPILLKTEMGAGHQGPSGRYNYYQERASYYGFVLNALNKN